MGACASKPKVKDDASGAPAPAPISVSKELVPDDDSPVEKALIVDNGPPPPAPEAETSPKEIAMVGDANGQRHSPKILLQQKSNESENPKSDSSKQEATLNEKPQMEGDLNSEADTTKPESSDNLGEGCDQIKVPMQSELKLPDVKKPVEAIKEQEPTAESQTLPLTAENGVSDKMVVENEHKLSNGINIGSKEEEEKAMKKAIADTKIENTGKSTVEKDSIQGGAEKGVMV